MATLLGNDYLAWIDSATPGTLNYIKGQGTFTESYSNSTIDTSDKTTSGYNTGAPGNNTWSGRLTLRVTLPDATGYTRAETVSLARPALPVVFQIRKNGTAGVDADKVFAASCYWSIASRAYNKDGTVDVEFNLTLAAAPTTNALA